MRVEKEIQNLGLGQAAVFGEGLRVAVRDAEGFARFAAQNQDVFTYKETPATLEDVFLKAVSGAGGEA